MPRPLIGLTLLLGLSLACNDSRSSAAIPKSRREEDLTITFGGFLQNGPEDQRLDGRCTPNPARDILQCDVHNGLEKWHVTEVTFQVVRPGDKDDDRHYYRERVSIEPLETETASFKLGMQLPADTYIPARGGSKQSVGHWDWLIVGAKGQRIE